MMDINLKDSGAGSPTSQPTNSAALESRIFNMVWEMPLGYGFVDVKVMKESNLTPGWVKRNSSSTIV